ncbi:INO80 complex subunit C [Pancytospora epiphaga]|nr:INO80 complex subunit C [Pancytospora epiphaga]
MSPSTKTDVSQYKLSTRQGQPNKYKSLKHIQKNPSFQNHPYFGLSRISVKPLRKLCDFTGLPTHYTCPRTSLRYYNVSVYKYLESLNPEHVESYYRIKTYSKSILNMRK